MANPTMLATRIMWSSGRLRRIAAISASGSAISTESTVLIASSQSDGDSFSPTRVETAVFWIMLRPRSPTTALRTKSRYWTSSGRSMPSLA